MSRYPKDYLQHILDEVEYLLISSQNLNKEDFLNDETLKRAFTRSLEIIGEASKNLAQTFKDNYTEIPWRRMAGIRDKLIHEYFGVDYDIVWNAVVNEIPDLKCKLEKIMKTLEEKSESNDF
jgi:uncharacterized protein with HEPN domain